MFDSNKDGYIDHNEMRKLMGGLEVNDSQWEKICDLCDLDKDGKINLNEFVIFLTKNIDNEGNLII